VSVNLLLKKKTNKWNYLIVHFETGCIVTFGQGRALIDGSIKNSLTCRKSNIYTRLRHGRTKRNQCLQWRNNLKLLKHHRTTVDNIQVRT